MRLIGNGCYWGAVGVILLTLYGGLCVPRPQYADPFGGLLDVWVFGFRPCLALFLAVLGLADG
jgi:hypothetical protein